MMSFYMMNGKGCTYLLLVVINHDNESDMYEREIEKYFFKI